jgi:hypothetical protein
VRHSGSPATSTSPQPGAAGVLFIRWDQLFHASGELVQWHELGNIVGDEALAAAIVSAANGAAAFTYPRLTDWRSTGRQEVTPLLPPCEIAG